MKCCGLSFLERGNVEDGGAWANVSCRVHTEVLAGTYFIGTFDSVHLKTETQKQHQKWNCHYSCILYYTAKTCGYSPLVDKEVKCDRQKYDEYEHPENNANDLLYIKQSNTTSWFHKHAAWPAVRGFAAADRRKYVSALQKWTWTNT